MVYSARLESECAPALVGPNPTSSAIKVLALCENFFIAMWNSDSRKQFCNKPAETGPETLKVIEGESHLLRQLFCKTTIHHGFVAEVYEFFEVFLSEVQEEDVVF